ncbi:hypothetical protein HDU67_009721 [Dinochytrium kinnereticum]|nr:hypothetical protein HDU67_009721 [Dinochytrium kinnereticum]
MTPQEVVRGSIDLGYYAFIKYGMPVILSNQTTIFTSQNSPRTLDLPKPISTTYTYNFNYQSSSSAVPVTIVSVLAIFGLFIALIFISRWYATKRINEIAADPEKMRALEAKAMNGSLQAMRTLAAVRMVYGPDPSMHYNPSQAPQGPITSYQAREINQIRADPEKMRALEEKARNGSLQAMRTLAAARMVYGPDPSTHYYHP